MLLKGTMHSALPEIADSKCDMSPVTMTKSSVLNVCAHMNHDEVCNQPMKNLWRKEVADTQDANGLIGIFLPGLARFLDDVRCAKYPIDLIVDDYERLEIAVVKNNENLFLMDFC